jgi:hypothetical protein
MYKLDVASLMPQHKGDRFQQYLIDNVPTIGAFGDEPYELRFYNKSNKKLQVRLSIDGTDIVTGERATTEPHGSMWVVDPYAKLVVKAWPETQKGGASFIFTNEEGKTVAANTHGDVSHKGIIAAAVFVEGYVAPPPRLGGSGGTGWSGMGGGQRYGGGQGVLRSHTMGGSFERKGSDAAGSDGPVYAAAAAAPASASMDFMSLEMERGMEPTSAGIRGTRSRSAAGTGAGAYQKQEIRNVAGLIKPTLETTIRLRYMWWDEVVAGLKSLGENWDQAIYHGDTIPSGFPGNPSFQGIDLKGTPRPHRPRPEPRFHRFATAP